MVKYLIILNFQPFVVACFYVFERKNDYFPFAESIYNEDKGKMFFCKLFCDIKTGKPFELRCAIQHTFGKHFYKSCVNTSLKVKAFVEACACDRTPHMPKPGNRNIHETNI